MSPERYTAEFSVYYSYNLEKMLETLNSRLNNFCSLVLVVLGSAVMGQFGNAVYVGFGVAVLSALQLVYRFGARADASRRQKDKYSSLRARMPSLSDNTLNEERDGLKADNSVPISALEVAAHNKALLQIGRDEKEDRKHYKHLNWFQCFITFLADGFPVYPVPSLADIDRKKQERQK